MADSLDVPHGHNFDEPVDNRDAKDHGEWCNKDDPAIEWPALAKFIGSMGQRRFDGLAGRGHGVAVGVRNRVRDCASSSELWG